MIEAILKRSDEPDEVALRRRSFGRATCKPDWKSSEHVGYGLGYSHRTVEHVGGVPSGYATAVFADRSMTKLKAGDLFCIPPEPHDSRIVGNKPYVSPHYPRAGVHGK